MLFKNNLTLNNCPFKLNLISFVERLYKVQQATFEWCEIEEVYFILSIQNYATDQLTN